MTLFLVLLIRFNHNVSVRPVTEKSNKIIIQFLLNFSCKARFFWWLGPDKVWTHSL